MSFEVTPLIFLNTSLPQTLAHINHWLEATLIKHLATAS